MSGHHLQLDSDKSVGSELETSAASMGSAACEDRRAVRELRWPWANISPLPDVVVKGCSRNVSPPGQLGCKPCCTAREVEDSVGRVIGGCLG